MKSKKLNIVMILLFVLGIFGVSSSVKADDTHMQTLTIVKYGLSKNASGFAPGQTISTGEYINNLPIYDNTGKELNPVTGISYTLQEVVATGSVNITLSNPASYQKVGNLQTIVTNGQGEANITLPDGHYILTELANPKAGLTNPQAPVLISLPSWDTSTNSYLSQIYVYPKSSVDPDEGVNKTPPAPQPKKQGKLPDTGEMTTYLSVVGAFMLILVFLFKNRRTEEEAN